jgi:hypothetical protein
MAGVGPRNCPVEVGTVPVGLRSRLGDGDEIGQVGGHRSYRVEEHTGLAAVLHKHLEVGSHLAVEGTGLG